MNEGINVPSGHRFQRHAPAALQMPRKIEQPSFPFGKDGCLTRSRVARRRVRKISSGSRSAAPRATSWCSMSCCCRSSYRRSRTSCSPHPAATAGIAAADRWPNWCSRSSTNPRTRNRPTSIRRDVRERHRHRQGADHRHRRDRPVHRHPKHRRRDRWRRRALKTPCSSVAWSLVSLPEETSLLMRSSILDLISPGLLPLDWSLVRLDWIEESMSVSADDSAFWSVEEIAPEDTWDCNSACNFCRGDW